MDFLTQTLLGAVAGHAALGRAGLAGGLGRLAAAAGALGGAVPDFDFLLRPLADPALPFELHRHFTHALLFIPLGGLIGAVPFLVLSRGRRRFGLVLAAATIGCATHGLLDNLTSYGTHLLWPFVGHRTAWDSMSIIDPLFSGVLLLGVLVAMWRDRTRPTRLALLLAVAYVGFGFLQHERADAAQRAIAEGRGHVIERGRVLPTLGNIVVFRSIYESGGRLWVDAVRVDPLGEISIRSGSSRPAFTEADLPGNATARTREVFRGLDAFTGGFTAVVDDRLHATDALVLGDMRISLETGGFMPLWGISIDDDGAPAAWNRLRVPEGGAGVLLRRLRDDVLAPEGRFVPLTPEETRP